jgi:signal transduction histidine kinase
LTQVLSNLVLNAAHAIGGQGTIAVNLAKTRPTAAQAKELGLEAGAVYATIKVADQGTGMDPATIARIFDPFFTTKPIGVGTGLGLSVVLGILKSWNGAVAVHSELGLGTTFTLFIPLMKEGGEADVMPARVQALQSVA